jgi:hypothetical protein
MNGWSKEDLEEMCGDDIIEQLAFVSGCHQHQLCNSNPTGWIIPDESLRKFAELIVRKCANIADEAEPFFAYDLILKHFGMK